MFTHTIARTYNDALSNIGGIEIVSADSQDGFDGIVTAPTTNGAIDHAFTRANLKALCLYSTKSLTIKTNFTGASGDALTPDSITVATNVATVATPTPHGFLVGDSVRISGCTDDADLNDDYVVASVIDSVTFTVVTASVTDGSYTEGTLRVVGLPQDTISLLALQANIWSLAHDGLSPCPFTGDVRALFVTLGGTDAATLKIRALSDQTP